MKIALMGSAPSSMGLAPFHDQSYLKFIQAKPAPQYPPALYIEENWDIWVCSPGAYGVVPRATRWFEVHRWEPGMPWFTPEYCQYLQDFNGPVYIGGPIPEIKNGHIYPYARVREAFGTYFLSSSLSLMAAIAILDIEDIRILRKLRAVSPRDVEQEAWRMCAAYKRLLKTMTIEQIEQESLKDDSDDVIGYWGVDMSAHEEYSRQKPGCWFFIHEALRRGIGHFAPPESDLNNPEPPYGLCEWDQDYIKHTATMRDFNNRITSANQQIQSASTIVAATSGAKDVLSHHIKTFMNRDRIPAGVVVRINPGEGLGPGPDDTVDGQKRDEAVGPAIYQKRIPED